jgi:SanA protein
MHLPRPRPRTLLVGAAAALGAGIAVVAGSNALVLLSGGSGDYSRPGDAPRAQAALVLGAAVRPDGSLTPMLADRVRVAAQLYREGKVTKVLASGDHGTESYDEVNPMKRALIAQGVPQRDVFTDHAGFDTWDSVVRARRVFGVSSALVVTQGFHLPRAVWLARRAGLDAHGVSADLHGYGEQGRRSVMREVFARVKAVEEAVSGSRPRYLGPPIPISGDGRASEG